METMNSETLVGHRVISQKEGIDLGRVRQVIFDASRQCVAALLLGDKELFGLMDAQLVRWNQIQELGENAVVVKHQKSRQKAEDLPDLTVLLEHKHLLPGAKLYTEDGNELGYIKDIFFDVRGDISGYELSSGLIGDALRGTRFLPKGSPMRLGEEVAFVASQAAEEVREMEKNTAE